MFNKLINLMDANHAIEKNKTLSEDMKNTPSYRHYLANNLFHKIEYNVYKSIEDFVQKEEAKTNHVSDDMILMQFFYNNLPESKLQYDEFLEIIDIASKNVKIDLINKLLYSRLKQTKNLQIMKVKLHHYY
jgi:hypothetical protein